MDYIKPFLWPLVAIWELFVVKPFRWGKKHWKLIGAIACAVALFICGWAVCKHYDQNVVVKTEVQTVEKEVPVEVPVYIKGDTEIRYVEKESSQDVDVQIESPAPTIAVSYNGEKTELEGVAGETQKFENGKLVVEQKNEAVLDVTPIVDREIQTAVKANTDELNKAHAEDLKKEEKHRHKREWQSFLYGTGAVGLVLLL